ncbi:MAG: M28 family peptidase [Gemmatimonadaceae bacterium]
MRFVAGLYVLLAAACGGAGGSQGPALTSDFDGGVALGYVKTQLDFGPRIPGSPGHSKTGDWIVQMMRQRADTVLEQRWTHRTVKGDTLPMRNILARYNPAASQRILYLTHWDTRPVSDNAVNLADRMTPVPGANDGASGTALMIALGDALKKTPLPPNVGLDILFTDGEDFGDWNKREDVLIGSTYFASHLPDSGYRPLFGVLWDMIGDKDLRIDQESYSLERAPEVVQRVWKTAADLGYGNTFVAQEGQGVTDDHLPLLDKGLRVIDVIDYEFDAHHTPRDTFDKVSARSLKIVGDVALALVRGI